MPQAGLKEGPFSELGHAQQRCSRTKLLHQCLALLSPLPLPEGGRGPAMNLNPACDPKPYKIVGYDPFN